jgi:hypothetical protein
MLTNLSTGGSGGGAGFSFFVQALSQTKTGMANTIRNAVLFNP